MRRQFLHQGQERRNDHYLTLGPYPAHYHVLCLLSSLLEGDHELITLYNHDIETYKICKCNIQVCLETKS